MTYVFYVTLFLTFTLLFFALFTKLFFHRKQMNQRIKSFIYEEEPEKKPSEKEFRKMVDFSATKERLRKNLKEKDKNEKLELMLKRAGVPLKPEEYILFKWMMILLGAILSYLIIRSVLILPIGAVSGYYSLKLFIRSKEKKRVQKFNQYLPEMISSIVNALRAGFSFFQAMKNIAEEAPSPTKEELDMMLKEMQYGATVEESFMRMKERVPSDDLDLMIQAILIQRQVGGNLAVVLEKIVHTIRERIKIQGQIKTLTAQGKLSGMVVAFLPAALAGMLQLVNPGYMTVLFTTPIGIGMIAIGFISMIIGFFLIMKITNIEV